MPKSRGRSKSKRVHSTPSPRVPRPQARNEPADGKRSAAAGSPASQDETTTEVVEDLDGHRRARALIAAEEKQLRLLTQLDRIAESIRVSEKFRDKTIEQAREAGCSWRSIAMILGVTPQAVQQRLGRR